MEVHLSSRPAHFLVPFLGALHALGDVCGVASDLRCHDAFVHIIQVREAQVLCRRDVAKEISAASRRQGPADGSGDMVVARRHVGDDRPQHIERRAVAQLLRHFHIHANIRNRHMPRAFHHDLHAGRSSPLHQFAQVDKLGNLNRIGGVMAAAAAASIAQRKSDVVFLQKLHEPVELFIERIFLPMHVHPSEEHRAAAGNEICDSFISHDMLRGLAVQPGMDGHEIHAVFRVALHNREEIVGGHILQPLVKHALHVVHGHRADGRRAMLHQPLTERRRLSEAREIHDGFRAHVPGKLRLRLLGIVIAHVRGNPQIHIHLRTKSLADGVRMQGLVIDVRRKHDGPFGDAFSYKFRADAFVLRCAFHFLRDDALPSRFQLCHNVLPKSPIKKSAHGGFLCVTLGKYRLSL